MTNFACSCHNLIKSYFNQAMASAKTILLSLAVAVLTPTGLHAQQTNYNFIYTYNEDHTAVILTDIPDTSNGTIVVPSTAFHEYRNFPVQGIAPLAFNINQEVTKVVISEGVEWVDDGSFYFCHNIESIELPNSLVYMNRSICGLSKLRSLVIPPNVVYTYSPECSQMNNMIKNAYPSHLETNPFKDIKCEIVVYPSEGAFVENGFVYNADRSALYFVPYNLEGQYEIPPTVTTIGDKAFSQCGRLTSVIIPPTVKTIGNAAFRDCKSLTEIVIPESVTAIGESAFEGCEALTNVILPDGLTSIPANAFKGCKSLTGINIPDSVSAIEAGAFCGCDALKEVRVTSITPATLDVAAFDMGNNGPAVNVPLEIIKTYLTTPVWCDMPNYTTPLGDCLRKTERSLNFMLLPDRTALLLKGKSYLYGTLTIPGSITNTDADGNYIEYPLVSITDGALAGYTELTEVVMPENGALTEICASAFEGCTSLARANLPTTVKTIGDKAFYNSPITEIKLPEGITHIGESAFGFINTLHDYCTIDMLHFPGSLESVGSDAFINRTLNKVSVDDITALCSVDFGNLYANPLYDAPQGLWIDGKEVHDIVIPEGSTQVKDYSLASHIYGKFNSLTLPSSLVSIGRDAFFNNMFASVSIPPSVTIISARAFSRVSGGQLGEFIIEDSDTPLDIDTDAFAYEYRGNTSYNAPSTLYIGRQIQELPGGLAESVVNLTTGTEIKDITTSPMASLTSLKSLNLSPSTVSIGRGAFTGAKDLAEIVCGSKEPPSLFATGFADRTYGNARLTVPVGSISAYRNADNWKRFMNIYDTEGNDNDDVTAIGEISISDVSISVSAGMAVIENLPLDTVVEIFDIAGRMIYRGMQATVRIEPGKGIYIVKIGPHRIKFVI